MLSRVLLATVLAECITLAHATPQTQEIPFNGIPLLGKTEEFTVDVVLTVSGFLQSIEGEGTVTAKQGSPHWNDFAVGLMYPAAACTLSYGGFTGSLRYPNFQGCATLAAPLPTAAYAAPRMHRPLQDAAWLTSSPRAFMLAALWVFGQGP